MEALWGVLNAIRHLKPVSGVVENVLGFLYSPDASAEKSALAVLRQRLAALGYSSAHAVLSLDAWHAVKRLKVTGAEGVVGDCGASVGAPTLKPWGLCLIFSEFCGCNVRPER